MRLEINGEIREVEDVETVEGLVKALGLPAAALLIELNGEALLRAEWASSTVREGDKVEILRVSAGG